MSYSSKVKRRDLCLDRQRNLPIIHLKAVTVASTFGCPEEHLKVDSGLLLRVLSISVKSGMALMAL